MGGSGRPPNPPNVRGAPAQPGPPAGSRGGFEGSGWPPRSLEALLALLQLADGLFPAGGFAHSLGLETYVQAGMVRDAAGLAAFLGAQLEGNAGPTDAVAVVCAGRFAAAGDIEGCLDLDARLDAMRWVPELRAASLQMGRQTLRTASTVHALPFLDAFARAVADDR